MRTGGPVWRIMCSSSSLGIHHGIARPPAEDALATRRIWGFDALRICRTKVSCGTVAATCACVASCTVTIGARQTGH
eukprot:6463726-Amphidinium_carterae.1